MPVRSSRHWGRPTLIVVALAVALALAIPAVASATISYVVNSTGDAPDQVPGAPCETATLGECTLRAAIQVSNSTVGVPDRIEFSAAFDGQTADTIELGSALPKLTDPVHIEGSGYNPCTTADDGIEGPCVGVDADGGDGLVVEASDTAIDGLAISGADVGISVVSASEGLTVRNTWLGLKLDGGAGPATIGIEIGPDSDATAIGGTMPETRNVIANSGVGLKILGADLTLVQGNYFGVAPDGTTAAVNGKDISVADASGGLTAEGTEIGGELSPSETASSACDGACNVISGATTGIDLAGSGIGESLTTGPTTISGNHIGLDAPGGAAIPNSGQGIVLGAAAGTTVGGPDAGDANHINGGTTGVLSGPAAFFLRVEGNLIGFDGSGTEILSPPSNEAIAIDSSGITNASARAVIDGNRVTMAGGEGILQAGLGARISANAISGALHGIRTVGVAGSPANTIEGNVIENSGEAAIQLQNDGNQIFGNRVSGSGAAGIQIDPPGGLTDVSGNLIGGNSPGEENAIFGSLGRAIEIVGIEASENEVGRNHGSGNGAEFIGLSPVDPGEAGPNGAIEPPAISSAAKTGAGGTAQPGALVRVFSKAADDPGELASFLGEATADGSGGWQLGYGALPGGTRIAATQTNTAGGTSELSATATTPPDPPVEKPPIACPTSGSGCSGPPIVRRVRPDTKITKAPKASSTNTTAKFKFTSSIVGSSFECKLDKGKFKVCRSPKTYKKLKPGRHVFQVRAVSPSGTRDPTPATKKFTLKE